MFYSRATQLDPNGLGPTWLLIRMAMTMKSATALATGTTQTPCVFAHFLPLLFLLAKQ